MLRRERRQELPSLVPAGPRVLLAACSDAESPIQQEVFAAVARERPDAVLFVGDASYAGPSGRARRTGLRRWLRDWGSLADRVYAVPGNHDLDSPEGLPAWRDEVPGTAGAPPGDEGLVFHVEIGPVIVVGMTAEDHAVGDRQLSWAAERFAESRAPHRIAVFHEPAWPCGHGEGRSLDAAPAARDRLWRMLEDAGVGLVLNGHEHGYSRRTVGDRRPIVQAVVAGAGARLYLVDSGRADVMVPAFHYLAVSASDAGMRAVARAVDGRIIDEFAVPPANP